MSPFKVKLSDDGSDVKSEKEPFKELPILPDFVRTTQAYLKDKKKLEVLKMLKD